MWRGNKRCEVVDGGSSFEGSRGPVSSGMSDNLQTLQEEEEQVCLHMSYLQCSGVMQGCQHREYLGTCMLTTIILLRRQTPMT
jgi:hypothetical protein